MVFTGFNKWIIIHDTENSSTALQFGVRTLKKTQTPWRKYNVEQLNLPLEISGETCPTKNV